MRRTMQTAAFIASLFLLGYGVSVSEDRSQTRWLIIIGVIGFLWFIALLPPNLGQLSRTNRALLHLALALTIGFGLVTIQVLRAQLLDHERIMARASDPNSGVVDLRRYQRERSTERGRILLHDGSVVAADERDISGRRKRSYRNASAAYLAGYYSPGLFGVAGLEAVFDAQLSGRVATDWRAWLNNVLHRSSQGNDIVLSIDPELQELGQALLGDRSGGIVLLDANSGAVRALVTAPAYDPNRLSVPLDGTLSELQDARSYLAALQRDGRGALLLRPIQGLYTPGSVFKTVTAAAAFAFQVATPDTVYRDDGALVVDSRVILEQNRPDPSRVDYTVREAYGYSLNVVFAQIGLALGAQRLESMSQALGFGEPIPFDLPVVESQLAASPEFLSRPAGLAETAFGQGQLQVTPMQMALVVAAVLQDGNVPRPYLVEEIRSPNGETLWRAQPRLWRKAFDAQTARSVHDLMLWSVEHGYAQGAALEGVKVGGKTGTAEVGSGAPHAWFVGFAEQGTQRFVIAVVVEHGGSGAQVALPIARSLLQAALKDA